MMVKEVFLRSTLAEMKADKKITHLKGLLADNPKTINVVAAGWMESFFIFLKNSVGELTCAEQNKLLQCYWICFILKINCQLISDSAI